MYYIISTEQIMHRLLFQKKEKQQMFSPIALTDND